MILYIILPERNVKDGKDTLGFYYPNAYAALKEINAIGLYSETDRNPLYYAPIDVESFVRGGKNRINANFNNCFIFTNENEKSRVIDYKKALPNMVGDFLYHTIVNLPTTTDGQKAYVKLTENSVISYETDTFSAKKERSVKFSSASIKRVEIPELEVIDLYGARMMVQLIYQQKYNNWVDNKGFLNEVGEDKTSDFVENRSRQDNFIQLCHITLDHLSLKTPHGAEDFRNSDDDWDTVSERLRTNALKVYSAGQEKLPIQYFRNYMDSFFSSQFRGNGMGVERYWTEKNRDIEQQTNYFSKIIEQQLLDLWVSKGDRCIGLNEINLILERLKKELKTISTRAANRISHLSDPTKFDVKDADFTNAGCNREINNLIKDFGSFINLNKKGTFETATRFILKLYKNKTDIIAYQFSIALIDRLIIKLDNISTIIKKILEEVLASEEILNNTVSEKNKIFKNEKDEKSYHSNNVKMLYLEGAIEREFNVIINEKSILFEELKAFRQQIKESCANLTFEDLHNHFNVDLISSQYLYHLNSRIPKIYKSLEEKNMIKYDNKLVGRNVLNYFQNTYKSMDEVKSFFKDILEETGVYAKIASDGNKADTLDSTGIKNYANDIYIIQYPIYRINDEAEKYEEKFISILNEVFEKAVIVPIDNFEKLNELTVFKAKANMSVRSFDIVSGMMHQKYTDAFVKQTKMANLTIHTESGADDYPKIIPFNDNEKEEEFEKLFDKELLSYFLLGYALGYIEKNKSKYYLNLEPEISTTTKIFVISETNSSFYDIKNFIFKFDIIDQPPREYMERYSTLLIYALDQLIDKRENRKEETRKLWFDKINNILPQIFKDDYEEDKTDKEYHKILKAVEQLKTKLLNF